MSLLYLIAWAEEFGPSVYAIRLEQHEPHQRQNLMMILAMMMTIIIMMMMMMMMMMMIMIRKEHNITM